MKRDFTENFFLKTKEEIEATIKAEIEHKINMSYSWNYAVAKRLFDELEFWGSPTPFERLGEIIFELDHRIELLPEDERPERWMYQTAIDNMMKKLNEPNPKGIHTVSLSHYPFAVYGNNLVQSIDGSWKK